MTHGEVTVLDASAFVRAFDGNEQARTWVERAWAGDVTLVAPELILVEVANALLKYVRAGDLTVEEALRGFADLQQIVRTVPLAAVVPSAFELGLERGLSAYDAAYLQMAEGEGIPLVTADRQLAAATDVAILLG